MDALAAAAIAIAGMQEHGDLDRLLDRLESEDIAVREAAAKELIEAGADVLPKLKAAKVQSSEARGLVEVAIREIERRARIASLWPKAREWTVALNDEPLESALDKFSAFFGLEEFTIPGSLKARRVTIDLKKAGLWDALDAIGVAADLALDWFARGRTRDRSQTEAHTAHTNVGETRIVATVGASTVDLEALLLPGRYPVFATSERPVVSQGKAEFEVVKAERRDRESPFVRTAGRTGRRYLGRWLTGTELKGAVTVKGTVEVLKPLDIEPFVLAANQVSAPFEFGQFQCTAGELKVDVKGWSVNVAYARKGDRRKPAPEGAAWLESDRGAWLADLSWGEQMIDQRGEWQAGYEPARLVIAVIKDVERVTVPFTITRRAVK